MSRMFPFITETWNPFKGRCPYECSYCWARNMAKRYKHLKEKYFTDEQGIDEKQINRKFKPGAFVFVQDMSDASTASLGDVARVMTVIKLNPKTMFLFLVKNPRAYLQWIDHIATRPPDNVILGATIETDDPQLIRQHSKAPSPQSRLESLYELSKIGLKTFISVEPIMDFNPRLNAAISLIGPWAIAVGYDNYHSNLPEPSLAKTMKLIEDLENGGIDVYRKTLRESTSSKELRRDAP